MVARDSILPGQRESFAPVEVRESVIVRESMTKDDNQYLQQLPDELDDSPVRLLASKSVVTVGDISSSVEVDNLSHCSAIDASPINAN